MFDPSTVPLIIETWRDRGSSRCKSSVDLMKANEKPRPFRVTFRMRKFLRRAELTCGGQAPATSDSKTHYNTETLVPAALRVSEEFKC